MPVSFLQHFFAVPLTPRAVSVPSWSPVTVGGCAIKAGRCFRVYVRWPLEEGAGASSPGASPAPPLAQLKTSPSRNDADTRRWVLAGYRQGCPEGHQQFSLFSPLRTNRTGLPICTPTAVGCTSTSVRCTPTLDVGVESASDHGCGDGYG